MKSTSRILVSLETLSAERYKFSVALSLLLPSELEILPQLVQFWQFVQTSVQMEIFSDCQSFLRYMYTTVANASSHFNQSDLTILEIDRLTVLIIFSTRPLDSGAYVNTFSHDIQYRFMASFNNAAVKQVELSGIIMPGGTNILISSRSTQEITKAVVVNSVAVAIAHPVRCSTATSIYLFRLEILEKAN